MGITMLIAFIFTVVFFTSTGLISVKLGSRLTFDNSEPDFMKNSQQNVLVSTLKKSLPAYVEQVISDPALDEDQITSLKLLYRPVINDFIKTGDIALIDKSNSIKQLIVHGQLRAQLKGE
jgi:hypothetical protein